MTQKIHNVSAFSSPFLSKKKKRNIGLVLLNESQMKGFLSRSNAAIKTQIKECGFAGKHGQSLSIRNAKGELEQILFGTPNKIGVYDSAAIISVVRQSLSKDLINEYSFSIDNDALKAEDADQFSIGWALGGYQFTNYKAGVPVPALLWPKKARQTRVLAMAEAIYLLRHLINMPANALGPIELEAAARNLTSQHKAKIDVISGKTLEAGFPLIHWVGSSSDRPPRLIDINWGKATHPKITLVGKGVCFDTGGLNLKPGSAMATMKKDMGGAAHVLALGHIIMSLGLKIRLRILIPAVENAVSGRSFRPGDIVKSRKGLTIENTNTDAEGRLILADTLAYACEDNPKLLIDFATLTGSARAALGPDIPALFSSADKLADKARIIGMGNDDPVWPMPLWQPYKKHFDSNVADFVNSASIPGDLIYSALFLQQFVSGKTDWIHLDCFAWEQNGRPGRPRGGCDTGLRTIFTLIEQLYE
jgi:leucyl aminopeptidase